MTHTPEPWAISTDGSIQSTWGTDPKHPVTVAVPHGPSGAWADVHAEHEANAARIVACVNGCAGIDTGLLQTLHPGVLASLVVNHARNAGLNPAGYRACVEALKYALQYFEKSDAFASTYKPGIQSAQAKVLRDALTLAEGTP